MFLMQLERITPKILKKIDVCSEDILLINANLE